MSSRQFRLAPRAIDDLLIILKRSLRKFGPRTAARYEALIDQAIGELADDPHRPGSKSSFDVIDGLFLYHLKHSKRQQASKLNRIMRPRHVLAFRLPSTTEIHILRILHERMKYESHEFPIEYVE
jgi:toxin ParE1/3/4